MQAKHVWTFYLRSMKPLAQRVIGLELVMNGHLIAKRERRAVLAFQSGLFSWTELAVDFNFHKKYREGPGVSCTAEGCKPFRATLLWNITAGSKRVLAGGPRPPPACLRHSRQACPGCCAHFPFGLRRRFHRGRAFDSRPPCSGPSGDSGAGSRTHFTLFLQWCAVRGLSHGSQNLSEVMLERFDPLFEVGGLSKLSW